MIMLLTPLEQFQNISLIPLTVFGLDFSFTNLILISLLILFFFNLLIYFSYKSNNFFFIPHICQRFLELLKELVSSLINKKGEKYFPLVNFSPVLCLIIQIITVIFLVMLYKYLNDLTFVWFEYIVLDSLNTVKNNTNVFLIFYIILFYNLSKRDIIFYSIYYRNIIEFVLWYLNIFILGLILTFFMGYVLFLNKLIYWLVTFIIILILLIIVQFILKLLYKSFILLVRNLFYLLDKLYLVVTTIGIESYNDNQVTHKRNFQPTLEEIESFKTTRLKQVPDISDPLSYQKLKHQERFQPTLDAIKQFDKSKLTNAPFNSNELEFYKAHYKAWLQDPLNPDFGPIKIFQRMVAKNTNCTKKKEFLGTVDKYRESLRFNGEEPRMNDKLQYLMHNNECARKYYHKQFKDSEVYCNDLLSHPCIENVIVKISTALQNCSFLDFEYISFICTDHEQLAIYASQIFLLTVLGNMFYSMFFAPLNKTGNFKLVMHEAITRRKNIMIAELEAQFSAKK